MSEKEEEALSMDQQPETVLVDPPAFDHEPAADPEPGQQPRAPDGKFASKETGDKPAEEAPAATPADNPIPDDQFKGYLTEKRKRQELEQQLAAMQQKFAQTQQKPQEQVNFWDDPDTALEHRVSNAVAQQFERWQHQQTAERIDASETSARAKYADYDDAFHAFRQAVQANPSLTQQMVRASDPAEFAYSTGKRALDLERVGSIDDLVKTAVEAERAKWEQEAQAAMPVPKLSFPTSTVSDGSAARRSGPGWSGPVSDRDILPMG